MNTPAMQQIREGGNNFKTFKICARTNVCTPAKKFGIILELQQWSTRTQSKTRFSNLAKTFVLE